MKKAAIALLMLASLAACKKDDDNNNKPDDNQYKCKTCINAPEAKAAYDQSSGGVYKGILVGSSGTIALYLYNTGTEVEALVSFDGQSGTLFCSTLGNWVPGQAIQNALFTGMINNQEIDATFSVDTNGQNPHVEVQIPGHDVVVSVYKETSSTLIKSFEGTYAGDDSGIFNMVFDGDDFSIITDGGGDPVTGSLVNGKISLTHDGVEINGSFEGTDEIKGTWKNTDDNTHGTWSGKRTL